MSGTGGEEDKSDGGKLFPLDLASKLTNIKAAEQKGPLNRDITSKPTNIKTAETKGPSIVMAGQLPRGVQVINTPQAFLKQDPTQKAHIINTAGGSIIIQRPNQTTLTTTVPVVAQQSPVGTTYHVPRGPAVVANLSNPRSTGTTTIRTPFVVAGSHQTFVRPPRTPSPAPGTAWIPTTTPQQIKGVLSPPLKIPVTVAVSQPRPQLVAKSQVTTPVVRPTLLHSAIIGHNAQIHSIKPGAGPTITLAMPSSRAQPLVYSGSVPSSRIAVVSTQQRQTGAVINQRPVLQQQGGVQQPGTQQHQGGTPVVTTTRALIPQLRPQQPASVGTPQQQRQIAGSGTPQQQSAAVGRLGITTTAGATVIPQQRFSTLQLPVLVANTSGTKVKPGGEPQQIHVATIKPGSTVSAGQGAAQVVSSTANPKTINVGPATIVTQQRAAGATQSIPLAKVYPQGTDVATPAANVFIHTAATVTRRSPPGAPNAIVAATTTGVAAYSAGTLFYEAQPGHYSRASTYTTVPSHMQQSIRPAIATQVHGITLGNQPVQLNNIVVVGEQHPVAAAGRQQQQKSIFSSTPSGSGGLGDDLASITMSQQQQPALGKLTSSPRPSILRKRDHDGSPLKAAKNLQPVLATLPPASPSPPSRPDSRGNGHSSGGSTTISATSSPGLGEGGDDSMPHVPHNVVKEEEERPPTEMSPRKKPRKQQLPGNDLHEPRFNVEDMQFLSDNKIKKEIAETPEEMTREGSPEVSNQRRMQESTPTIRKPATASLLNSYRQTWKATHNHYVRYSDVRPKDERRAGIMDLANQYRILDKVNGWKVHHLSTQMEEMSDNETDLYDQLSAILKVTEDQCSSGDEEVNRIVELIKGNMQRSKIIYDGMIEAKTHIMKIFDHKSHVADIITRCASKRNFKKREKS